MIPRLFGSQASPFAIPSTPINTPPALGDIIAEGFFGVVHEDLHDASKVIKVMKSSQGNLWPHAQEECELFNRYYGDNSAELLRYDGKFYLRMDRLPGVSLYQVNVFREGAEEFFFDMLREMESKNIFHADLKADNVLYCAERNRFYPVDITNNIERQYPATAEQLAEIHANYTFRVNAITHLIINGCVAVEQTSQMPPLGQEYGCGQDGTVYIDREESDYVWKRFRGTNERNEQKAQMEASAFNRYYGSNAAQVMVHAGRVYIKMLRVPGIPLKNVAVGGMDENALEAFHHMLSAMASAKIMQSDLYDSNIHYDLATNRFYPIDIQNHYYDYFMGNNMMKKIYNISQHEAFEHLTREIKTRIVPRTSRQN